LWIPGGPRTIRAVGGEPSYERLSAQDASFVQFEDAGSPSHVTAVAVFEGGGLAAEANGALDMDLVRAHVASRLHLLPHYRQRLAFTPIQGHAIWVDDERFDLACHVRHAGLPAPGDAARLKELAGRIASQPLDRSRPLWELWFVEGLAGGGFAAIAKVHHCMVDGVSGVGVIQALLSPDERQPLEEAREWAPRPAPGTLAFLADGVGEGAAFSASLVREAAGALLRPRETVSRVLGGAEAAWKTLRIGLVPPAESPLNGPIGRQRRTEWTTLDLREIRDLRKRLDGSINDVVLSIVAGAMRGFLRSRGEKLRGRELRVVVPVDMRTGPVDLRVGNRVSSWFVNLPLGEPRPMRRFERIRAQTRELKRSEAAQAIDGFMRFADWTGSSSLTFLGVNLISAVRPYNLIVTNVHGPQLPLYLLGARLREFHPLLPLFERQGLAIAAMSYLGRLSFGLCADWNVVPDVHALPGSFAESLAELRAAADARK
jgi:WS/DGAT/MGAT family acyltransferase